MTRGERRRRRFFDLGAKALHRTTQEIKGYYGCPICLTAYDHPEAFTLEDVPPKSIGGKPLVLTCGQCNNEAGQELDHHIRAGLDFQEIAAGTRPIKVRVKHGSVEIGAQLQFPGGGVFLAGDPKASDPRSHKKFFEALERASAESSADFKFDLQFKAKYDAWREAVAWLRVGYLYAFAALGYRYILRPELDAIRNQIRNPSQKLLPQLSKYLKVAAGVDGILFVHSPIEFRCIAIQVGRRVLVLPDLEHPSTFESRIQNRPNGEWPPRLSGKSISLPSEAEYALDFDLNVAHRISPPGGQGSASAV